MEPARARQASPGDDRTNDPDRKLVELENRLRYLHALRFARALGIDVGDQVTAPEPNE